MKRFALLLCSLLFAGGLFAQAQSPQRFGDLIVYHNTFNSSYLQPDIAAQAGLTRGPTHGVLNLLVQKKTDDGPVPVDARVDGTVTNLLQQSTPLRFIRIQEGEAVYFLANYTAAQRGLLRFELTIQESEGAPVHTVRFQQEFHPDD
ncbi:DUF4426 domain-containing protein [Halopseudomonas salegens]|uniref:DUF4426 domain-containing protein n=1 Tax=Halopseudomonas salegens TaxID=1434072 RepID=A0A1H2HB63_9GAMM|nr:DUF4426 domain-containing protein [Halopseudomonas salegens]SDU29064.1 protein of unknown function [Halopseudomonas salegens]